ncbi:MAG: Gfo/Idh/MocA family oxidoreductase [Planctomycetes bacterium]|nr:Gfo/Idh/MocA family oxidoreductase [Planctomycetota bacterium]
MKQVLQNLRSGETVVEDVPAPGLGRTGVLIRTRASLISAGTERMLVEFGKASLLAKARSQPDKVKQVLDKIRTDGLMPTLEAVFRKLDEPMPLGYCNAGEVLQVAPGVTAFQAGDRVVSNGPHAEIVAVPANLCAKIPDAVTDEQAAFTVISSIGLQGIRLTAPTFGEKIVVYGLGLIGVLCVQMLRANGCAVLGIDVNADRLALAEKFGAAVVDARSADPVTAAASWTAGKGVDGVIITAAAKTDDIVHNAAAMCRKRGRIVLVGVVGLNLRRSDFYDKELTFQVSCSYGPGRYDEAYEQGGQDYPRGFVRWTEQRNFEAVLDAMASGQMRVDELITHHFPIDRAGEAYAKVSDDPTALGVVLTYADGPPPVEKAVKVAQVPAAAAGRACVGVIGAGAFSTSTLLPSLAKTGAQIAYVADLNGAAAKHAAAKYGIGQAVSDYRLILDDPAVDAVLIAVGHNLHARFVCEALAAGKHAFVEKPLAMNDEEIEQIRQAAASRPDRHVMVGFNRRFSPHTRKIRELLRGRSEPLCMSFMANAGIIPPEHWVHDPVRGGGRIVGEACHYIDLLSDIADSPVRTVAAARVGEGVAVRDDKMSIVLTFEDGSVGTVNYFANGAKSYPKETAEIYSEGRVLRLENFRRTTGYGFGGFRRFRTASQDKGHAAEFQAFVDRVAAGGEPLIPLERLINVARASLAAVEAARTAGVITL